MASSFKTPKIKLNKWASSDPVLREDFNADNDIIEAALSERGRIATGTYVGTGTYGADNAITLTFDFKPMLVIVAHENGWKTTGNVVERGCIMFRPLSVALKIAAGYTTHVTWDDNAVSWYATSASESAYRDSEHLNNDGDTYYYIAIGI